MSQRNPKQEGSNLYDCRPQIGLCPIGCSQCFYNRPGAFYCDIDKPQVPEPKEVGDNIIRMNSGHDSNLQRGLVIETAKKYKHFFFNTSIPRFDFPGPVVFTANPKEEEFAWVPTVGMKNYTKRLPKKQGEFLDNIMFVRLRVSPTNLKQIEHAAAAWVSKQIPIVLTFMAYYDGLPSGCEVVKDGSPAGMQCRWLEGSVISHIWKIRHINSYYCATKGFMFYVVQRMKKIGGRLVSLCGSLDSNYCRDCRNCETYYYQVVKHIKELGVSKDES